MAGTSAERIETTRKCYDERVKLALIVPGGFGHEGSGNVIPVLSTLATELSTRHEVHVFAFSSQAAVSQYRLGNVLVHLVNDVSLFRDLPLHRRALELGRLTRQLVEEVRDAAARSPFDLLHAFWATESGLLAGLLGRWMRVPVVLSVCGGEAVWLPDIRYGGCGSAVGRALNRFTLNLANEVTIGSAFARSFLRYPAQRRAQVIPLGVDCRKFDAPPYRAPGPPWRLLHVASRNAVKDHTTLLRAFAEVVVRLKDVWLECVGDDTLAGAVESQARALGLGPRVRFRGFLLHDDIAPLYRSAHLLVLSSRYESQAVVVLEAAAAGLPTVGTAVGLLPTLSPEAARMVAPGEPTALADAVCTLLLDETTRRALGARAQSFAKAHDVAWTARSFEKSYERLVRNRRSEPLTRTASGA
jgi:glycosyltransferase involved in cell wall biosynthesis